MAIKVTVKGEQDAPPFTRFFQYRDQTDEAILSNCVQAVQEKLNRNLKINVNESLTVYCYYIASALRAGRKVDEIIENASSILLPDNVMIGVPETLREIIFDVAADGLRQQIVFGMPIQPYSNAESHLNPHRRACCALSENSVTESKPISAGKNSGNRHRLSLRGTKMRR